MKKTLLFLTFFSLINSYSQTWKNATKVVTLKDKILTVKIVNKDNSVTTKYALCKDWRKGSTKGTKYCSCIRIDGDYFHLKIVNLDPSIARLDYYNELNMMYWAEILIKQ